jgi:hypothetical protein
VPQIIDSRQWLRERLAHLHTALEGDLAPEQREAIEAEIGRLTEELKSTRGRSILRWLGFPTR